jgi:hypothetical protein
MEPAEAGRGAASELEIVWRSPEEFNDGQHQAELVGLGNLD